MIWHSDLTATYQVNGPIPLNSKRTGNNMSGKWEFSGLSRSLES